jgi:hypothetical protein
MTSTVGDSGRPFNGLRIAARKSGWRSMTRAERIRLVEAVADLGGLGR